MKSDLKYSNLEKIYWPKEGYTKKDLIEYYDSIKKYIFPYLSGKPQSLHRFPDGIYGEKFYQKNVHHMPPDWVNTEEIWSESNQEFVNYIVPDDVETILYMANLGCIEMNPWNSKYKKIEKPDYLVIDLDPEEISFSEVVKAAQTVHEVLEELLVPTYVKTSGATGLHIYVPTGSKYEYEQIKNFAHLIVARVHIRLPKTTSLVRMPAKRKGKVYLDFLQNSLGQTMVAPYSVRPRDGAPVSMPLKWSEVNTNLKPEFFTIKNALKRIKMKGDIFQPVLGKGFNLEKILKKFEKSF